MASDEHTDRSFDELLRDIRADLLHMAAHLDAMIQDTARAVLRDDAELSRRTEKRSALLGQLERQLDRQCMVLLATRAPVASDLSFVMSAMRVSAELGRVAELAAAICERAVEPFVWLNPDDRADLEEMAELVREMLQEASRAFAQRSAELARGVIARDREVNERFLRVFQRTIELMGRDAESVRSGVHVQSIAKRFERMADHAVRAAEHVLSFVGS